ncbi:MAG: diguanylate cyclase [Betaproteobacteria bacterium]|nr:diguanylate cyclase [Betaproteobacteria bacterium]MBI2961456.1 diguanylate cyclase [Betaproteobacteria bacterium]
MSFLDAIETQMICNRLPLAGVSVAAIPCADTPAVLSLHWHGFVEHRIEADSGPAFHYEAVPSSCLQVNERWRAMRELEHAVMDVAWELGAWDLTRHELRPYMRPGAPCQEAIECEMAFGRRHRYFEQAFAPVSEVQDGEEILSIAARRGYLMWRFRPVRGGMWDQFTDDATLEPGRYRNPPCPHVSRDFGDTRWMQRPRRVVYRFGRPRASAALAAASSAGH